MLKRIGTASVLACSLTSVVVAAEPPTVRRLPATVASVPTRDHAHSNRRVAHEYFADPPEPIAPGAAVPGLSLEELERMALTSNPSIARAEAMVTAARGNWVQVGLAPNPTSGYEGQQIGSGGRAEQDGVFVEQEFVRGGKLRLNRAIAAQEIQRLQQQVAAQRQRVRTDVRVAFYSVLVAQQQEQLTQELLRIASQNVKAAETLLKGQEVGRVDLVQAELEYENATILAQNAAHRRAAAWQSLASVIGQPQLPPQALAGDPEADRDVLSYEAVRERLLSASPEIAAAVANLERARWALQRANVEAVPNVTVQGLVNWRDEGINGDPDGGITVGVPIPAWNRNQGGILQAQGEVAAAQRSLEQLELDLQNRLAPVYERYSNARHQVKRYRTRILPAAQETLQLTRRLYEAGETSYVNLLTVQRTFSQTNFNYLEALRDLRASESELEGLLLSGSLEQR